MNGNPVFQLSYSFQNKPFNSQDVINTYVSGDGYSNGIFHLYADASIFENENTITNFNCSFDLCIINYDPVSKKVETWFHDKYSFILNLMQMINNSNIHFVNGCFDLTLPNQINITNGKIDSIQSNVFHLNEDLIPTNYKISNLITIAGNDLNNISVTGSLSVYNSIYFGLTKDLDVNYSNQYNKIQVNIASNIFFNPELNKTFNENSLTETVIRQDAGLNISYYQDMNFTLSGLLNFHYLFELQNEDII